MTFLAFTRQKIWGVGKVTASDLAAQGIRTIKDLRITPLQYLQPIVGNAAEELLALAVGRDNRPIETETQAKSLSSEYTSDEEIADRDALLPVLQGQVEEVAQRLRRKNLQAGSITLKFRYADFRLITRRKSFSPATATTNTLWQYAKDLFDVWYSKSLAPIRLIGFGVSNLTDKTCGQLTLFPDPDEEKQAKIDQAIDSIQDHFGPNSLRWGGF